MILLSGCLLSYNFCSWTKVVFAQAKKGRFAPVRFGVISDPHIDLKGINGWKMGAISLLCLQKTIEELNSLPLDFILIPGDLLLDGELRNLVVAKKLLDKLKAPYYIIAGNHDYCPADPARRKGGFEYISIHDFVRTFVGHGYNESGDRHWAVQLKPGLRLLGLDGCLIDEKVNFGGRLPQEQIRWLDTQLASHEDDLHIIFLHHNLVHWGNDALSDRGRWFSLENNHEVRAILEAYADNVGVVLSGHRHIGLRNKRLGSIDYVVVPSVNSYPMRYALFQLSSGEFSWKTPGVPVRSEMHVEARKAFISIPWLSDLQMTDKADAVDFYENNQLIMGARRFDLSKG